MAKYKIYGKSDRGAREHNEDSFIVFKNNHNVLFAVVADGMGGHYGGKEASKFAVLFFQEYYMDIDLRVKTSDDVKQTIVDSFMELIDKFKKKGIEEPNLLDMGTTANLNIFIGDVVYTANAGDTRSYKITTNNILQISQDHNLAALAKEDDKYASFANQTQFLTSALGPRKETKLNIYKTLFKPGETLIICTDGVHNYIEDKNIKSIVNNGQTPREISTTLFKYVLPITNDNVTIVTIMSE